jgi:prenyltransferase beta subunit
MNARTLFASLCVLFLFALASQGQSNESGYHYVVSHLEEFQTPSGGFTLTLEDPKPSLEATSHALFLASLFGLKQKINTAEAAKYIASLENLDKGFGKSTGAATELEAIRHAVLSYQYLGNTIPNSAQIVNCIKNLVDPQTGLFSNRGGEKGDLKSTALALQTLKLLGETSRQWVQDLFPKIKDYLSKHAKHDGDRFYFAFEEKSLSTITANYYGIVLGKTVGYDFVSPKKWVSFILPLQSKNGGFYSNPDKKAVSVEDTAHAILSLHYLQPEKDQKEVFVDLVDTNALLSYLASVPRNLRQVAQAHLAVALTKAFAKNFETTINYEFLGSTEALGKHIVQGAQLKPVVTVKTVDGVPHAGLDIDVVVSFASSATVGPFKLVWANGRYSSAESVDTRNQLGEVRFVYTISSYLVDYGLVSFQTTDVKLIGYGVVVDPQARLEVTGKEFKPGDTVAIGTDFDFSITLRNQTHDSLISGNFDVIFSVLDSSLVSVDSETINCKANTKPLRFSYSLKSSNIPSGELLFRFEVASSGGKIHTTETVTYQLSIPMIAADIKFDGVSARNSPPYKIGQKVKVSIEPASFPDLRTVHAFSALDKRHFVMDVSTPSGSRLRSIDGKAKADSKNVLFEVPIPAALDSIGVNVVSFRYLTASGVSVPLANYDSAFGELYEDAALLNYTVQAKLRVVDIKEKPETHDFFYGNDINFRFKVKDVLSNQYVEKGSNDLGVGNVYLSLKHKDVHRVRPFTSAHEAAQQVANAKGEKEFVIHWSINPNAVQGEGFLTVSAEGADGGSIDLYMEDDKPVHIDVKIGGEISAQAVTFSTSESNAKETALIAQFELSCQNRSLKDAQLRGSVYRGDSDVALFTGLPVATNDKGLYSFSLGVPHDTLSSGRYKLKFYREVDRKRALETRELIEKKRLREEQLKAGEAEEVPVKEEALPDIERSLTPLFEISLYHSAPSTGKLPIRPEIIVALILGGVFFAISYQKKHYMPLK